MQICVLQRFSIKFQSDLIEQQCLCSEPLSFQNGLFTKYALHFQLTISILIPWFLRAHQNHFHIIAGFRLLFSTPLSALSGCTAAASQERATKNAPPYTHQFGHRLLERVAWKMLRCPTPSLMVRCLSEVFARVLVNFFEEKWPAAALAWSFLCMGARSWGWIVAQMVS